MHLIVNHSFLTYRRLPPPNW